VNRRQFFKLMAAAAAGLAVDPEQLLWTPKPIITVPAMPQQLGISMRFVKEWEYLDSDMVSRFDVYFGPATKAIADKIDADMLRQYGATWIQ
jgi:hypothetical protein